MLLLFLSSYLYLRVSFFNPLGSGYFCELIFAKQLFFIVVIYLFIFIFYLFILLLFIYLFIFIICYLFIYFYFYLFILWLFIYLFWLIENYVDSDEHCQHSFQSVGDISHFVDISIEHSKFVIKIW